MNKNEPLKKTLRRTITDEAFRAMGFPYDSAVRKIFGPLMAPASGRFAHLAARVDRDLGEYGIAETSRLYLPDYVDDVMVCGAENIPESGPLLIASNHPGTLDALVILSNLKRDDIKLIISGVPVVESLPGASRYLIYTPYDDPQRIRVVRDSIRHLKGGGVLMIFPTGKLDPDPACLPGAAESLNEWSTSLDIFLRRVPETTVIPTIVSGVFAPYTLRNPLTKLRKEFWMQQRIAEYIQVIQMIFFNKNYGLRPKVSFGEPVRIAGEASAGLEGGFTADIIRRAAKVLDGHTSNSGCPPAAGSQVHLHGT